MTDTDTKISPLARSVKTGKDLFSLLRDASVFVLAILLFAFPTVFNKVLVNAGFEEGSLVGFKWKSRLTESDDALKEARATIANLNDQLRKTQDALEVATKSAPDATIDARASELNLENARTRTAAMITSASAQRTIRSNEEFVRKAQDTLGDNTSWVVVFGGDVSLAAAQDELKRAKQAGIQNPQVYFRQGSYRSVAITDDRAEAERLTAIARPFRPDAYFVPLSRWCPTAVSKGEYIECGENPG